MLRAVLGLTTRGRCLLAAGLAAALCAWALNERELLRVAAFVITLPLLAVVLLAVTQVRIHAQRKPFPQRVPAGAECAVRIDLWRSGRLPAGQTIITDGVPYGLGARPRFVVQRLPHDRSVPLSYPLRPVLRGVHHIGTLHATIADPFGLCEVDRPLLGPSRITVIPATVELAGLPFGGSLGIDDRGTAGRVAGIGDPDAVVRQYRHGDDLRRVHWPSTARRDELMVRLEERPRHGSTTIMLDHRAAAHAGTGTTASLEWAVSFVASACLRLRRGGHGVRLVNHLATPLAELPSHGTSEHEDLLLDALAEVRASHEREITTGHDPAGGGALIAVLGGVGEAAAERLCRHRRPGAAGFAVLLDTPSWAADGTGDGADGDAPALNAAQQFQAAGWDTCVVTPGTDMHQVWTRICTSTPRAPVTGGSP
ncbi:DUF58 domain-containing protein [Haloechinothrix sp. LS1_15]|uniref:DUF58 domain-containing protein n=1 Tax=Haloechinothrix sp. LS1_15 TaxID=2652248 RepID=UPI0029476CFE|nr:DUF58 domain-containing protein [Haloechinothrix sp. LS1_15]MDV6012173.1 DUF58 domain-containing protein [Haloechinothrix sp. LS1_15]